MKMFGLVLGLILIPFTTYGKPDGKVDWQTQPPASERNRPELTLDVRLLGAPLGTFIDEPSQVNKQRRLPNGATVLVPNSGFGGLGYSLGLTLGLTYDGFIGFETGALTRSEKATGTINSVDIEITQSALTVPLLMRLTLPTSSVQPSLLFGMALHYPSDTQLESLISSPALKASADAYSTLHFGFELEFKLPVASHDIRIPLSIRGHQNQGLGDGVDERMRFDRCDASGANCGEWTYITEWQWAAEIFLGLSLHTQLLD